MPTHHAILLPGIPLVHIVLGRHPRNDNRQTAHAVCRFMVRAARGRIKKEHCSTAARTYEPKGARLNRGTKKRGDTLPAFSSTRRRFKR
jgi:hypothetical protein